MPVVGKKSGRMRTLEVGEEVDGRRVEEVVGAIEVVADGLAVALLDLLQKTNGPHQRFHTLEILVPFKELIMSLFFESDLFFIVN